VSVSLPQYPSVTCVNCAGTFAPELYVIVDSQERPDLVDLVKKDIIHVASCPHCSTAIALGLPLMIYRSQESVRVMYSPCPGATPAQQHEHLGSLFEHLRRRLGKRWDDGLTKGIYFADRADLPLVVDCNVDLLPGGRDPSLREAMMLYLDCDTWEQASAVVRTHPAMLGREAAIFFQQRIARAQAEGDTRVVRVMGVHLAVLETCNSIGVDNAFSAKLDGSGRTRMPGVLG
jgi:CpXC protein